MKPMEGVRVVEVATWTFVPAAGAVLAEWGAEVIKIEHPEGGDPQRGLVSSGLVPDAGGVNFFVEQPNHGKKSVAINVQHPAGREILQRLCRSADVFLTNLLPGALQRSQLTVEDIRTANPDIIYVRGHGQGVRGPDADRGGYDNSSFFARSGVMHALSYGSDPYGPTQPPAFGDLVGGMNLAGAIAAALLGRARTGQASVVDVSLLASGMWINSPDIVLSGLFGKPVPKMTRDSLPNPIVNRYMTKDNRLIQLVMLQAVRFWPELVTAIGRADLADDERFTTPEAMFANRVEAIALLDEVFATRTLAEWKAALADIKGVWAVVQQGLDLYEDVQVQANGYLAEASTVDGRPFQLVSNPAQFDEQPNAITRAPELGEHTDEVLAMLGYSEDDILQMKIGGTAL